MDERIEKLSDSLIGFRGMIWSKTISRRARSCEICDKIIPVNSIAWRPMTNSKHRMKRISGDCMDGLLTRADAGERVKE